MAWARWALAVGYLGTAYHDSQIQPGLPTIEDALSRAVHALEWADDDRRGERVVRLGSRTDAGVHARLAIGEVDLAPLIGLTVPSSAAIQALNARLPADIVVLGTRLMQGTWRSCGALRRTYRYLLAGLDDWPTHWRGPLREAAELMVGEHDWSGLARIDGGRAAIREVSGVQPWMARDGRLLGIEVTAPGSLWHQVRRMAGALLAVAGAQVHIDDLLASLAGHAERTRGIEPLPPQRLVLWSVEQEDHDLHALFEDIEPAEDIRALADTPVVARRGGPDAALAAAHVTAELEQLLRRHWHAVLRRAPA